MKKFLILGFAVILIALSGYFAFFKKPNIANYPSHGQNIIAFGDSLVYGNGSTQGHDFVTLLSQKISVPITNLGVSGDTTAQGLARINAVLSDNPKVVIVLLGGNDALQRVPIEQTFSNLDAIVGQIKLAGAIVVLVGVQGGLLSDPYASKYKALAEKYHSVYVPNILNGIFGNSQYLSEDGVHPNDAGYMKIADKLAPIIQPLVQ